MLDIFGKCPQAKTISFFISVPFDEYTKKQIAIGADISRTTLDNFIETFVELKILLKKNNGKYELNTKSDLVKMISKLQFKLSDMEIEKQLKIIEEEGYIEEDELTDEEIDEFLSDLPDYIELNDENTKDLILEERKELERLRNIEKEFKLMIEDLKENNKDSENKLLDFEKLLNRPKTIRN